jgi:hypothetical protein
MNWETTELSLININFSSKAEGKYLISLQDTFINNLSPFDLEARCDFKDATKYDYLLICRNNVLEWTDENVIQIERILMEIDGQLKRHGMAIPFIDNINLVKTTSKEEGGAMAYTRGNTIYMADYIMNKTEVKIKEILTHELFHILTRSSFTFKQEMYNIIHFTSLDKTCDLTTLNQRCRFVSNPDVGNSCSYIELKDINGKEHRLMMTTLARCNYHGGSLFKYILPYFIELDSEYNVMTYGENLPVRECIYGEYYREFIKKVGQNTGYMVNPEEILAENFRMAVLGEIDEVPDPEIINNIRKSMIKDNFK